MKPLAKFPQSRLDRWSDPQPSLWQQFLDAWSGPLVVLICALIAAAGVYAVIRAFAGGLIAR